MAVLKKITTIILLLFGLAALLIYLTLYKSDTKAGYIITNNNDTQIFRHGLWEKAESEMEVDLSDKIRTHKDEATVIFYDSIIVNLKANTEISIDELTKDNIQITQKSGAIWNTFTDILGIEKFKVKTPRALATVRGTEFGIDLNNEKESIALIEGGVDVKVKDKDIKLAPLQTLDIHKNLSYSNYRMNFDTKKSYLYLIKNNLDTLKKIKVDQENKKKILKLNASNLLSFETPVLSKHRKIEKNIEKMEALVKCLECQTLIENGSFYQDDSALDEIDINLPEINLDFEDNND